MAANNFSKFKHALNQSGLNTIAVVRHRWPWVIGTALFVWLLKQHFAQYSSMSSPEAETLRLVGVLGEVCVDLSVSVVVLFIAPITVINLENRQPLTSIWSYSNKHIYELTVEGLRVLTSTLIWALFLIIPGLYRSIQLSFFPFVVMFDPLYQNDDSIDCIQRSKHLMKGVFGYVLLVGLVSLILDTSLKASPKILPAALQQSATIGINLLTVILSIYTLLVSFHLFRQQAEEKGGNLGTDV